MFCKFQRMCYFNVETSITTKNVYWLFITAKREFEEFFVFQSEGNTIRIWNGHWSGFLRDTFRCYSPKIGFDYKYLKF
jgi:hypothetical protein